MTEQPPQDTFDRALALTDESRKSRTYRPDPKRPGYCHAWRITYSRKLRGIVTDCQDGQRFYASKADAERDAADAMRRPDPKAAAFGPLIAEVRSAYTHESCLDVNRRLSDEELSRLSRQGRVYERGLK